MGEDSKTRKSKIKNLLRIFFFIFLCVFQSGIIFFKTGDEYLKAKDKLLKKPDLLNTPQKNFFQKKPVVPSLPPVKPEIIYHGSRRHPYIALTFDACEQNHLKSGYDKRIIDILLKTTTPATLFLGGKWMLSHPDETLSLSKIPIFELANHSYSHPDLRKLRDQDIIYQIRKTQEIMYTITGNQGSLLRMPFGYFNRRVLQKAGELGLKVIQWDVVSGDPDKRVTSAMIKKFVLTGTRNGSIIIMHMNKKGYHTPEALNFIINELRRRGYKFVKVGRLLEIMEKNK